MIPVRALSGLSALLLCAAIPAPAQAWRFCQCEAVDDYDPGKGVIKLWSCRIRTEWETRHHCLPCGRKEPYRVKVITYRERYSNGVQRTWKCVVAGSEVYLGTPAK